MKYFYITLSYKKYMSRCVYKSRNREIDILKIEKFYKENYNVEALVLSWKKISKKQYDLIGGEQ